MFSEEKKVIINLVAFFCFVIIEILYIFAIYKYIMKNKKILIGLIIASVLATGLSIFVYIKKKNNESWKLIKLPNGAFKRNKNIKLIKSN